MLINTLVVNIAGFYIKIRFLPKRKITDDFHHNLLGERIYEQFKGFITVHHTTKPNFIIELYRSHITLYTKNIADKKIKFMAFFRQEGNKFITYQHISVIQFLLLIKTILKSLLAQNKGFILHASAIKKGSQAIIFTGNPDAGKSTAMKLLNNDYPSIADDSVIIKKEEEQFYCYQTPFVEKNKWVKKGLTRFKLVKIFFLRKASYFETKKISDKQIILSKLMSQVWTDTDNLNKQLGSVREFIENSDNFYWLYFAKNGQQMRKFFKHEIFNE